MCVGRYRLLRRLAMGGMAELHLARAEGVAGFQKVVVLKRVLPNLAADEDFTRMFLNEARLAAQLDHPHVVQVMDLGESEGEFFYVMEYVHGQNLRAVLKEGAKRGRVPLDIALSVVADAAEGLHYAHERVGPDGRALGLVHRDVSPSNVLVSYDGAVKVADFGIAKASAITKRTRGTTMKGKIGYMSPEQCRGAAVDRRSDVFSLGILLYELTTTQRLFFADNDFVVINKVVAGEVDPPSSRVDDYPEALEAIVMKALAVEPEDRFPTARALGEAIDGLAERLGMRRSAARIAKYMGELFGQPEYPAAEVVTLAGGTSVASGPAAVDIPDPLPVRRSPWPWVGIGLIAGGALAAGIAIGAGLGDEPAPTGPPTPAASAASAPSGSAAAPAGVGDAPASDAAGGGSAAARDSAAANPAAGRDPAASGAAAAAENPAAGDSAAGVRDSAAGNPAAGDGAAAGGGGQPAAGGGEPAAGGAEAGSGRSSRGAAKGKRRKGRRKPGKPKKRNPNSVFPD